MSGRGTSVTVPMHCDRLTVDAPVIAPRLEGSHPQRDPFAPRGQLRVDEPHGSASINAAASAVLHSHNRPH
jgi:hypothetical protein